MRLTLVRHGETEWNRLGKIQGITDIPLNENGIKVAKITKEAYDRLGVSYDAVYSSPLQRAQATARILVQEQPITVDERLQEMRFGMFEGVNIKLHTDETEENKMIYKCFYSPEEYVAFGDAESFEDVLTRVRSFLEDMHRKHKQDEHILVVCHGGVIHAFLTEITKRPIKEFWNDRCKNLGHVDLECDKEGNYHIVSLAHYYYNVEE